MWFTNVILTLLALLGTAIIAFLGGLLTYLYYMKKFTPDLYKAYFERLDMQKELKNKNDQGDN